MAKRSSYMTRALQSRDPRYARVLGKLGYEADDVQPVAEVPQPAPAVEPDEPDEIEEVAVPTKAELAAEFQTLTGLHPNSRWNKAELEQELERARAGKYQRRDMRADD